MSIFSNIRGYLVVTVCAAVIFGAGCSKKGPAPDEPDPDNTVPEESPVGDVVGQVTTGYQGWFSAAGDGSTMDPHWWHWTHDWQQVPNLTNISIKSWPDNSEYEHTYVTNLPALGNGQPATLFSSYDDQTVDVHFKWMKDYGIHTAALQRFSPYGVEGPIRDAITAKVRTYAEKHNVKFYIMYDVSGWQEMHAQLKEDWTNKMKQYTQSSAYAKQNGKPVVGIWGFGFNDENHPFPVGDCVDVIEWFKEQGCYVMGGVPTHWRTQTSDSRLGYIEVYKAFDMLSPWMVGRIANIPQVDNHGNSVAKGDLDFCVKNGIDYQPCILPGDLQERQRAHGEFMWRQFVKYVEIGVRSVYISMFDEYNEGNQIAKTAETQDNVPQGSGMLALDEDGTFCTSDYYLRITNDGGKMLRKEMPLTLVKPTAPNP